VCYGIKKRNLIDSLIGTTPGFNQKDTLLSNSKDTTIFFDYVNQSKQRKNPNPNKPTANQSR
jgi:hypothetical protein